MGLLAVCCCRAEKGVRVQRSPAKVMMRKEENGNILKNKKTRRT